MYDMFAGVAGSAHALLQIARGCGGVGEPTQQERTGGFGGKVAAVVRATYRGPMDPAYPCRELPTRHCPALYEHVKHGESVGGCAPDEPCARFDRERHPSPWLTELVQPLPGRSVTSERRLFEEIGPAKDGRVVIQDTDGNLYVASAI